MTKVNLKDESPDYWKFKLERDERGEIKPTIANCTDILAHDTRFKGFAWNVLAGKVEVTSPMPWSRDAGERFWCKDDREQLISTLDGLYAHFRKQTIDIAFTVVADSRRFNPLKSRSKQPRRRLKKLRITLKGSAGRE